MIANDFDKVGHYDNAGKAYATVFSQAPAQCAATSSVSLLGLPQRWVLNKTKDGALSSTLNITTLDGTLLNAITTRSGMRSDIIIHQGQSTDSAALATARTHFFSFKVTLDGILGQKPDKEIPVKTRWWRGTTPQVTWQMTGRNEQRYDLEWKNANGRWKLMRRGAHGEDCVANWTVSFSSSRLSGEFDFEGEGVRKEMESAFPYVASISALALGKLMRDTLFSNAAIAISA